MRMKGKIAAFAAALALVAALTGCMGAMNSEADSQQQANRAYMSQVNEIMMQVDSYLGTFVSSVSSADIVAIRSSANDALSQLAKLSSLEAPDDLKDIQTDYQNGSDKLSDALNQYVQLYADVDAGGLDQAAVNERIGQIQSLYNEGYDALKQADEAAAAL